MTWLGHVFFGYQRLAYAGPMTPTRLHAHHAWQIVRGVEGDLTLVDAAGDAATGRVAIVPPDTPHGRPDPAIGLLFYIDPDGLLGRRLRRAVAASMSSASWVAAAAPLAAVPLPAVPTTWPEVDGLFEATVGALVGPDVRPAPVHPSVLRTLRAITERVGGGDLRLAALASFAGLSAGRLGHVFSDEVGIPLRRYVLWARMRRAAELLQQGRSITDAAQAGGFSDAAHMSRSFRRMFGLTPSDVAGVAQWMVQPK